MEPPFWARGGRTSYTFEGAMVVFYRLSIVTVALSVTIRPQFAIECLRRSNQQGLGHFRAQISGCSPWSRSLMFGSAESERPRLTNGEIISEEFQPMWSQSTNVTHGRRDGRTDRQTTCDRKTALCTKVHRAVKTISKLREFIMFSCLPCMIIITYLVKLSFLSISFKFFLFVFYLFSLLPCIM